MIRERPFLLFSPSFFISFSLSLILVGFMLPVSVVPVTGFLFLCFRSVCILAPDVFRGREWESEICDLQPYVCSSVCSHYKNGSVFEVFDTIVSRIGLFPLRLPLYSSLNCIVFLPIRFHFRFCYITEIERN